MLTGLRLAARPPLPVFTHPLWLVWGAGLAWHREPRESRARTTREEHDTMGAARRRSRGSGGSGCGGLET